MAGKRSAATIRAAYPAAGRDQVVLIAQPLDELSPGFADTRRMRGCRLCTQVGQRMLFCVLWVGSIARLNKRRASASLAASNTGPASPRSTHSYATKLVGGFRLPRSARRAPHPNIAAEV